MDSKGGQAVLLSVEQRGTGRGVVEIENLRSVTCYGGNIEINGAVSELNRGKLSKTISYGEKKTITIIQMSVILQWYLRGLVFEPVTFAIGISPSPCNKLKFKKGIFKEESKCSNFVMFICTSPRRRHPVSKRRAHVLGVGKPSVAQILKVQRLARLVYRTRSPAP